MDGTVKYIFEAGMLKRVARSGWWAEKIGQPESVADHSFRTAVIAFILARMERLDAERLCTAAAFHDMHEARLSDLNKITARYITVSEKLERRVEADQAQGLPAELRDSVLGILKLTPRERTILKDADYLECAFQAKEYYDVGHKGAATWIGNIAGRLKTKSAKALLARMKRMDSNSWWKGLKKLD
ncbi:MAG: HD domain-containing protein [Candidatus ainarchaeum sp.]|nr:HD domain-containing protein [Candidatus ainarchaeum sp.]